MGLVRDQRPGILGGAILIATGFIFIIVSGIFIKIGNSDLSKMTETADAVLVRDNKGKVIKNTIKYAIMHKNNEDSEKNIIQPYIYEVVVKKHSTLRFAIDFNLLANSCGCIKHTISLIK